MINKCKTIKLCSFLLSGHLKEEMSFVASNSGLSNEVGVNSIKCMREEG